MIVTATVPAEVLADLFDIGIAELEADTDADSPLDSLAGRAGSIMADYYRSSDLSWTIDYADPDTVTFTFDADYPADAAHFLLSLTPADHRLAGPA